MARSSLAEKQFDQAMGYAKETKSLTIGLLKGKSVDSDEHLATAQAQPMRFSPRL